jgi:hypothetical protein
MYAPLTTYQSATDRIDDGGPKRLYYIILCCVMMLYYIILCCVMMLWYIVLCCIVLYCIVLYCIVLFYTVLYYIILYYIILYYIIYYIIYHCAQFELKCVCESRYYISVRFTVFTQFVSCIVDPIQNDQSKKNALHSSLDIYLIMPHRVFLHVSIHRDHHHGTNTGMRRITTFRSTTDRIYVGSPIRLWYIIIIII